MNRNTIRARLSKVKLWKRYKMSKSCNDYVEYRRAQKRAVKEYRKTKLVFVIKKASFGYFFITDPSDLGNCLNNFFGSMFTDEMMIDILEVKTNNIINRV